MVSAVELASELVQLRHLADQTETPFAMLVCSSQMPISPNELTSFLGELLYRVGLLPGPVGLLDVKRLGIVIKRPDPNRIEDLIEGLRDGGISSSWDLTLMSYPIAQPSGDGSRFQLTAGIEHDSLHPFFTKPTPWAKRLLDIAVSSMGLLCLSPLLLMIAVCIRLSSPGPVFFRQKRSGLGGVPFVMYKFRSMVDDAELQQSKLRHLNEQDGPAFKIAKDPRVTRIGRFLRFSCLDETPQLYNVLIGDMSLVGPRPLPCHESDDCRWWHRRRLDVAPGMTCIWQARGRTLISFDQWMRMDLDYVQRRSMKLDFQILYSTFKFLLYRQ